MKFVYTQKCPVTFGEGTINDLGAEAAKLSLHKVMLVTDKVVSGLGYHNKAISSLQSVNIEVILFDEIMPECPDNMIKEAVLIARSSEVDGIIGLGGGSSLDAAKAIALIAPNSEMVMDDFLAKKPTQHVPLKIILLPTNSGTGSEVTNVAVIFNSAKQAKQSVFANPDLAIIDPELMLGTPKPHTAAFAMDALSHAAECMTVKTANPHSDVLAMYAISNIMEWLPIACGDLQNQQARTNLALASNFAGIAFADTGVGLGHQIGHAMGARLPIPHGVGCALALPTFLELTAEKSLTGSQKVKMIGQAMGLSIQTDNGADIGRIVSDELCRLMHEVGIMSLKEQGIREEQFMELLDYLETYDVHFAQRSFFEINRDFLVSALKRTYLRYQKKSLFGNAARIRRAPNCAALPYLVKDGLSCS
jgi:alcohol dehydrogenase